MRTLPHSACSLPIPPSRTSVPCSLPRLLWLTATLALVPSATDAFIKLFVKDKCQAIMEDVDKLDNIQDGFIHYQLIKRPGCNTSIPVLRHASVVSAQNWSTGDHLCGGDAKVSQGNLNLCGSPRSSSGSRRPLDVISVCTLPGQHVG